MAWPAGVPGPAARAGSAAGSLVTAHDMQRGPPRPLPSSLAGTGMTWTPAAVSLALVSRFRSSQTASPQPSDSALPPSSHWAPFHWRPSQLATRAGQRIQAGVDHGEPVDAHGLGCRRHERLGRDTRNPSPRGVIACTVSV